MLFFNKEHVYYLKSYDHGQKELNTILWYYYTHVSGIHGMDLLAGKNLLYLTLKKQLTRSQLCCIMPKTYTNANDFLQNEKEPNKIFIAKKNVQRQEGLKLFRRKNADESMLKGYVVIQEYLKDPFLINKKKINLRIYMLIIITDSQKYAYIYNDGFIYYTQNDYKYSTVIPESITTGLQKDRRVYKENPLTLQDLHKKIKTKNYNKLFNNIKQNLTKVFDTCKTELDNIPGSINFQLFGCDIQPDLKLNVKLIEINKSPSLQSKDYRDYKLKKKLQQDILDVVFDCRRESNLFEKLK
jgi:Tubulin-tyrosine ligase family